jgi:hypothetical protein
MRDADSVGGQALPALHFTVGLADSSLKTSSVLLIVRCCSHQGLKPACLAFVYVVACLRQAG